MFHKFYIFSHLNFIHAINGPFMSKLIHRSTPHQHELNLSHALLFYHDRSLKFALPNHKFLIMRQTFVLANNFRYPESLWAVFLTAIFDAALLSVHEESRGVRPKDVDRVQDLYVVPPRRHLRRPHVHGRLPNLWEENGKRLREEKG